MEKAVAAIKEQRDKSWKGTSRVLRIIAKEVLGITSGKPGRKEETWWWYKEVQEAVRVKEKKKLRDQDRYEETVEGYKAASKSANRAVAKAKAEAYKDLYDDSLADSKEGQRKAIMIAKQKNRESQDSYQGKQMEDANGVVLTEDDDIRERWKTYFEQLLNVENDRIERVIATSAESEVENITTEEVERALRKMKKGKATGPDDIPEETWKVLGKTGVDILQGIFNTIMESKKMPDEWRNSMLYRFLRTKVTFRTVVIIEVSN